jgi:hypothetical protein
MSNEAIMSHDIKTFFNPLGGRSFFKVPVNGQKLTCHDNFDK